MTKIFNFIKDNTTKMIAGCLIASAIASCNPTIDSLAFDIEAEGDKEDLTGPTASFSFFEDFDEENNKVLVTFSNSSSNASMYSWNFGNGQTSTDREFTAAYDNPDSGTVTYDITLDVSDNLGATDSFSDSITVGETFFREPQLIDDYDLINTGEADDLVTIFSFSSEQVGGDKVNFAANILDKDGGDGGNVTVWTSSDEVPSGGTGDGKGDGEYVIIDLGANYELGLIRFQTDLRTDLYYAYQIQTSTTGTTDTDFSFLLPEGATTVTDWAFTESGTADWQNHVLTTPTTARYVKLTTFGRYKSIEPLTIDKLWSNWAEIEFFSTK